ncbi:hypothetical protein AU467_24810 [Mesorhizobium loti]|uniref:Uncharacterized protein n=1 Tax=Rhizobium loti TaxID=381 RepID=A0A124GG62_RHILI|nr:hypothetical protein AU467_24810 [Mesorhizobium loti]
MGFEGAHAVLLRGYTVRGCWEGALQSDFEHYEDPSRPKDMPVPQDTLSRLAKAAKEFLRGEADLLEVGVNERSLTHRLAVYIGPYFKDWHVDCEYNRLRDKVKSLPKPEGEAPLDDTNAITIYPDIIVHRRQTDYNCAVIEVKKRGNNDIKLDVEKLRGMTMAGEYEYTVGLHLVIDCKAKSLSGVVAYRGGDEDAELTELAKAMFMG